MEQILDTLTLLQAQGRNIRTEIRRLQAEEKRVELAIASLDSKNGASPKSKKQRDVDMLFEEVPEVIRKNGGEASKTDIREYLQAKGLHDGSAKMENRFSQALYAANQIEDCPFEPGSKVGRYKMKKVK